MQTQLADVLDRFEAAQARVHGLAESLDEARWAERADPARWSVSECIDHLNRTGAAYVPLIEAALNEARSVGAHVRARYRRDPVGWALSLAMGPVRRVGRFRLGAVRTTSDFMPVLGLPREQLLAEFDRLQGEQTGVVRAADGYPIDRVWVTSPFNQRLRYNLYATFVILSAHQLRHVVQAERVWQ